MLRSFVLTLQTIYVGRRQSRRSRGRLARRALLKGDRVVLVVVCSGKGVVVVVGVAAKQEQALPNPNVDTVSL